jgi:cation diffusion facilitator CzcD-associated flavoprotein CzcO
MKDPDDHGAAYDPDAVRDKYLAERAKRMTPSRGVIHDLKRDARFAKYTRDPFTPVRDRDGVSDDVDVAIIGAGMAGVVTGAKLRDAGVRKITLIDTAGGIGGTWYWNRYPGVMCDVESYIYLPMLEEMDYIPTHRYAFGDEIRRHLEAIATAYDLVDGALFHSTVDTSTWDERLSRWVVRTDRGDEIRARYLVQAVGILNLMKIPVIPGMDRFSGASFHTARWDYDYTGGGPTDPRLSNLADKVVGVIGSGASAIQAIPPLVESARHVYLFQRTPSVIGERNNAPTDPNFAQQLYPGWQRDRMENFSAVMFGRDVERDLVDDGWTRYMAKVTHPTLEPGLSPEEAARRIEASDFAIMEHHRRRIDQVVADPAAAEILKPYYRYMCKRPCFHDEYLPTFNSPRLTLVDCPAGVAEITERGAIANDVGYELDCIIYATGFEAELTPLPRRVGHTIVGRGGVTLEGKWRDGVVSLHGVATHGFPNMFFTPAPAQHAVVTTNYTHGMVRGAEHIAATVALLDKADVRVFDVSSEAEETWTNAVVASFRDSSAFMAACTPSRLNFEGDPSQANPRNGSYGGSTGDLFGYQRLLAEWRTRGDFAGWDVVTAENRS